MSVTQLNDVSEQVNRYSTTSLILFGCIGNIFNCAIFLQRTFRSNPCAMYFLFASLSSILALISGLSPRILTGWDITSDYTESEPILCKLRLFVLFTTRCIPPWLIVLASEDRYLISSSDVNIYVRSNLKQAYRWIVITCISSLLIWVESVYCFDANLIGTPLKCYAKSDLCRAYNDLAQALITIIIPSTLMFIFGFGTIKKIRQFRRIVPSIPNANKRNKRIENTLLRMSISIYQITFENFLFRIFLILSYVPYCVSFYFFFFSDSLFRETFFRIGKRIFRQI